MFKVLKSYIKQLKLVSKNVVHKTGKSWIFVIIDIIYCSLIYGASPNNYWSFGFYNIRNYNRKTFLTHRTSKALIKKYNHKKFLQIFEDKTQFAQKFNKYFGRDWLKLEGSSFEEFEMFLYDKEKIIAKPSNGDQGRGIEILNKYDYSNIQELFGYLQQKQMGIIEELIQQHEKLSILHDGSVNSIRVVTITRNGNSKIIYALLTLGKSKGIANLVQDGISVPIELETGLIYNPAIDENGKVFYEHPESKEAIIGFQIPFWNEVLELASKASQVVSEIGYVGWDIALTNEGPVLIEGNSNSGYTTIQNKVYTKESVGLLPKIKNYL